MKLHSKTILVLLGTLVIGIALGVLWQSTIHNRRMEELSRLRSQGGLYSSIDRYIDPVDQAQEDTLRSLSKTYQKKLGLFYSHYLRHKSILMDSLKTEMVPLLSGEQTEQIAPWFERVIRRPRSARSDSTKQQSRRDSTQVSSDSTGSNSAN